MKLMTRINWILIKKKVCTPTFFRISNTLLYQAKSYVCLLDQQPVH